jgi:hypothetical protein
MVVGQNWFRWDADTPAADVVETVLSEGYVEIANRYRATLPSTKGEPAPLIEQIEDILEKHSPVNATPLFERLPDSAKTEYDLMFVVKRPRTVPQLYPVQRDEKLIRAALRLLF